MSQGKVKAVIDSTYEYTDVVKAFARLKSGRTQGKIVIHVTEK